MAGLALILDSSESYINFQKQELLKKWNLKSSDVVALERDRLLAILEDRRLVVRFLHSPPKRKRTSRRFHPAC